MELNRLTGASSPFTDAFKNAIHQLSLHRESDRITLSRRVPAIKVLRLLAQIAHSHPDLAVERVEIDGHSGCSDFAGTVHIHTPEDRRTFKFVWDCRWRAEVEGWEDCFGFPDQIRAANEFSWRCFRVWTPLAESQGASIS